MVDPELLSILRCPETKAPLHLADDDLLGRLNTAIASGAVKYRNGELVEEPVEAALVREDKALLYAVREGIPVMLIDESIALAQLD
jgi:uncharacterized protein YbaR (Trm112 family)